MPAPEVGNKDPLQNKYDKSDASVGGEDNSLPGTGIILLQGLVSTKTKSSPKELDVSYSV